MTKYDELLAESIQNPKEFWSRMACKTLVWDELFTKEKILDQCNLAEGRIHWFDGRLNASGVLLLLWLWLCFLLLWLLLLLTWLSYPVNCLDRHADSASHKPAVIWERNDGGSECISYQWVLPHSCQAVNLEFYMCFLRKLLEMTCQIAHVLKKKEVAKGDVVLIYMSSSPLAVAAMLACTRIGAVHRYAYSR